MGSPEQQDRYHIVPRDSIEAANADDDVEAAEDEVLLHPNLHADEEGGKTPREISITINPVILLRVLAIIIGIPAVVLMFLFASPLHIAAGVFMLLGMLLNISLLIHHCVNQVWRITIERRSFDWRRDIGKAGRKPRLAIYFDLLVVLGLLICAIIATVYASNYSYLYGYRFIEVTVFSWVLVVMQFIMAIPQLQGKTVKFSLTVQCQDPKKPVRLDGITRAVAPLLIGGEDAGSSSERGRSPTLSGTREEQAVLV